MKHTITTMKGISGSVDNDRKIAAEFCQEALAEAQTRLDQLNRICNLGAVLDAAQLSVATDARAGIRHIRAGMRDVAELHNRGGLAGVIGSTESELTSIKEEAEGLYRWLHQLYYRD